MLLVGQVSWLVKNINIGSYSDIIKAINVKRFMVAVLIELSLFIPRLVTLTIFERHSNDEQF